MLILESLTLSLRMLGPQNMLNLLYNIMHVSTKNVSTNQEVWLYIL